jgi:4-diphosphocytidyl-2-C-methyl-D-erythritol kinase
LTLRAPAKLNLCLYLGPRRQALPGARARREGGEGLHEIRSLFCPLTLADRILVTDADADELICPGVEGPNLASETLTALRARGWRRSPVRVEIEKRIPVAAGLGGGSADAAALLRLARDEVDGVAELAVDLGADVPSQLDPEFALVGGAGEEVEPLPPPGEFAAVLVPGEHGLRTADVYAEADRLGLGRDLDGLYEIGRRLRAAAGGGASPLRYAELLVNDLAAAALSLRPEIAAALSALEEVGAEVALIAGSGPTACGLFEDIAAADRAAGALPPRYANAIVAAPETSR